MSPLRLISFGYLHLPTDTEGNPVPPAADRIEDVRDRLHDPAAARANNILDLDGTHPMVQTVVLGTPGAQELIDNLVGYAALPAGPTSITIGCAGGKHRACALTEILGQRVRELGRKVEIEHLHAHLPRVLKKATPTTATSTKETFMEIGGLTYFCTNCSETKNLKLTIEPGQTYATGECKTCGSTAIESTL